MFALRSQKDPQAVTMRFADGRVEVTHGVAPDTQVVATVDLDNMSGPDAAKAKVSGALRRPFFALGVSKLLDPPARSWVEHAAGVLGVRRRRARHAGLDAHRLPR